MKIDILAVEGSPLGVSTKSIYGDDGRIGVGGAELALLTMCEAWHNKGYQVRLYNNPNEQSGTFSQHDIRSFNPADDRDILISFRTPNSKINGAKGLKVFWSCDQQTRGDFSIFAGQVDKVVCISDFHANYFLSRYGIGDTIVIDLPVRVWDYENKTKKLPRRVLFSSVPERGLDQMKVAWDIIYNCFSDAELVVTSDYRLWGLQYPNNDRFRLMFAGSKNVHFLGAIKRKHFNVIQQESQVLAYPCTYDELFCIAVAEAQVAGVYPVTSTTGALATTNMGIKIVGDPRSSNWSDMLAKRVIKLLDSPTLAQEQKQLSKKAIKRFHPDRIVEEWDKRVFNG